MRFDKTDKKLLAHLYHHYRDPLAQIARACGISKSRAAYRIKMYEQKGLIMKYMTIFDYGLLGYNLFATVWIRCKDRESLRQHLDKTTNIISYADVLGKYDFLVNFLHKNHQEFETHLGSILSAYKKDILGYSVSTVTRAEIFDLKMFGVNKTYRSFAPVGGRGLARLDWRDVQILKMLEKDGRARIVDMAKETGISSPAVMKRLRALKDKGVIQGTRLLLNMELFGYAWGEIQLQMRSLDQKTALRLTSFCREHPHVNSLYLGIATYNCNIQVIYREDKDLRGTVRDVLAEFSEEALGYDILLVEKESSVNTLPLPS